MNQTIEKENKIKFCKVCSNSSEFHKFKGLLCCKCASKKNNEKFKEKQYYINYYEDNKDILLPKYITYYADIVKLARNNSTIKLCL